MNQADPIDMGAQREQEDTAKSVEVYRARAKQFEPGQPGNCQECRKFFNRIVRGMCARCRDGVNK